MQGVDDKVTLAKTKGRQGPLWERNTELRTEEREAGSWRSQTEETANSKVLRQNKLGVYHHLRSFSRCIPALLPLWAGYTPCPQTLAAAKCLCFGQRSLSRCDVSRGLPSWACALPGEEHALGRCPHPYRALKRSHTEQPCAQTAKQSPVQLYFQPEAEPPSWAQTWSADSVN